MRLLRVLLVLCSSLGATIAHEKREIVSLAAAGKASEIIEGSGDYKTSVLHGRPNVDQEIHGSGYGSDDEDSEGPVHGSGDIVEGSGAPPPWSHVPAVTTTTTTTHAPPVVFNQQDNDHEVMENHALGTAAPEPPHRIPEAPTTTPSTLPPQAPPQQPPMTTRRPSIPAAIPPPASDDDDLTPFHQTLLPGLFAAIIAGALVAVLVVILVIGFIVYRLRKKDEGSYALDEPKGRPYAGYAYTKASTREIYA